MQTTILKAFSITVLILLMGNLRVQATHIVGGELELTHLSGNIYRVGLVMYFDAVNGNPGAIDEAVLVHIFDKRTNEFVRSIELPLLSDTFVDYTNPECAVGDLVTRRIYYARDLPLEPLDYTEPQGYYMIWERCCRNRTIDNIVSPEDAGQTFYLEFPPLIQGRERFINSSPRLFPPLSDYACANQPFTFDFSGTDDDGDNLTYRLTTPIQGNSSPDPDFIVPPALPAPYPRVTFVGGVTEDNMIPGNPPLTIDRRTGILNLSAADPGLYVFAVTVEERRNGVKIGEVRREYQLLVLDCPVADEPEVVFFPEGSTSPYREGDIITLQPGVESCGRIEITDPNFDTQINGEITAVNFDNVGDVVVSNPNISGTVNGTGETLTQELCLQGCPDPTRELYALELVIGDNSCSVPLFDTLSLFVRIEPAENVPPAIETSLGTPASPEECQRAVVTLGESLQFEVVGRDNDGDTITLGANNLPAGMSFPTQTGVAPLSGTFNWTPTCDDIDPEADSVVQRIEFLAEDQNRCLKPTFDTLCVDLTLLNREFTNLPPQVASDLREEEEQTYTDSLTVGEAFDFTVLSQDPDNDSLSIELIGTTADPDVLGVSFTPTNGLAPLSSQFQWQTDCDDLDEGQPQRYDFEVITTDYDFCGAEQTKDTIRISLWVLPEENQAPQISTTLAFDPQTQTYNDTIRLTDTFAFDLIGEDADNDSLVITGTGIGFDPDTLGVLFEEQAGRPQLLAPFEWATDCELAEKITYGQPYTFLFVVQDIRLCPEANRTDTLRVNLVILPPEDLDEPPVVTTDLPQQITGEKITYFDTLLVGEEINFTVRGEDPENGQIRLEGQGTGFDFTQLGMIFPDPQTGTAPLTGDFIWQPTCDLLPSGSPDTTFMMDFIVTEIGICGDLQSDTVCVALTLMANPLNQPPRIRTNLEEFDSTTNTYTLRTFVGQPINFEVIGEDQDFEQVFLNGRGADFAFQELGMQFENVSGTAPLSSPFSWETTCDLLEGAAERTFELLFSINDIGENCNEDLYGQTRVRIVVSDYPTELDFEPYNVFTPNGDGFNDTFTLPIQPPSCRNPFERIVIFNRWGKEVFSDNRRDFSWDGADFPDGVYFYKIFYRNTTFKGSVSLLRGQE